MTSANPTQPGDTRLAVTYDGPATATGRIDVRILAGAMASVAQLVDDSARLLYGADSGIRVEVSGDFKRGSFSYQIVATAVAGMTPDQVKEILVWLGLLSGPTGLTVIGVLKWLRGRKVKAVTREGNDARITAGPDSVIVNLQVAQLVMNNSVRADLEGVTQPLAEPGIRVMRTGETVEASSLELSEEDREFFLAPPQNAETLHEGESLAVLQIVAPVFKIGNKWQFCYPGEGVFHAPILDRKFLARLQKREVAFAFGDLVRVRLQTTVTRTESGALSTVRQIVEVLEVLPPAQVMSL